MVILSSLFSRKVISAEVKQDNEPYTNYVRVLDPHAQEISFVRTDCRKRGALFVTCDNLGTYSTEKDSLTIQ